MPLPNSNSPSEVPCLKGELAPGDCLSNGNSAPGWLRLVRPQIVGRNVRQHQQAQVRQGPVNRLIALAAVTVHYSDVTQHVVRLRFAFEATAE